MPLTVYTTEKNAGVFVVSPSGSLDTDTFPNLEKKVDEILEHRPSTIIFDMQDLNYISSAGVRVVLKTKKAMKELEGNMLMLNLQPPIKKVFEIINALPAHQIFSSIEELDAYLDKMQRDAT